MELTRNKDETFITLVRCKMTGSLLPSSVDRFGEMDRKGGVVSVNMNVLVVI